jgi:hypothetical protein
MGYLAIDISILLNDFATILLERRDAGQNVLKVSHILEYFSSEQMGANAANGVRS